VAGGLARAAHPSRAGDDRRGRGAEQRSRRQLSRAVPGLGQGGAQRAADVAPANGRAEAPGVMDVLSRTPRRRRRTRRS
jgi:hypothetical protein